MAETQTRRRRGNYVWALSGLTLAGAIALGGCSGATGEGEPGTPTPGTTAVQPSPTATSASANPEKSAKTTQFLPLKFDDLGGTYKDIFVYAGAGSDDAERIEARPTYRDEQVAAALCKEIGRSISSNPEQGEREVDPSKLWFRISHDWAQGDEAYASAVYVENVDMLEKGLPTCDKYDKQHPAGK